MTIKQRERERERERKKERKHGRAKPPLARSRSCCARGGGLWLGQLLGRALNRKLFEDRLDERLHTSVCVYVYVAKSGTLFDSNDCLQVGRL